MMMMMMMINVVGRHSALWINVPGLILLVTSCSLAGMVVYAEYRRCDPLATNRIHANDQVSHRATLSWSLVKVKCAILHWSLGGVLISLPKAMSP